MRKIKNIKFKHTDLIIIFICIAGTIASGIVFWKEYNRTLTKLNETPVATIVFKKNTAQRRFIDRGVWDRLKLATSVYNGDTIRTIEKSEAIVVFEDEVAYLSLDESTMVQIFANKQQGARIELAEGNLEVASEQDIVVSTGDSNIVVSGQAAMNKSDEGLSLAVIEGQASLNETKVESGSAIALDAEGKVNIIPMIAMTSFGSSARVLGKPDEEVPVVFSWNEINFEPDTYVIVEIAEDSSFNNIDAAREVKDAASVSFPLKSGSYRWRAYPASENRRGPANRIYPSGSLEIIPAAAPVPAAPLPSQEFVFSGDTRVSFSWSAAEGAVSYLLEISSDADMRASVVSRRVNETLNETSITQRDLGFGVWYWRVTPVYPARSIGSAPHSVVNAFSLKQGSPPLAAPVLTLPLKNGKVSIEKAERLLWKYDSNALSWTVEIADNPQMQNPAVEQNVKSNFFPLPPDLLQAGKTWYWRVLAMNSQADSSNAGGAVSDIRNFEVVTETPPAAKPVLAAAPYLPIIYFSPNTAETIEANARLFAHIVSTINTHNEYTVTVEGHANYTIAPEDTAARLNEQIYELRPLSEMRAKAVVEHLVKLGVDPKRLKFSGIGGEKPLAAWEDVQNWRQNRRVEFVFEKL